MDQIDIVATAFEMALRPVIEALTVGHSSQPVAVNFYGFKDIDYEGDQPNITRPCVIVQQRTGFDDGPAIAGSGYGYVAEHSLVVYIETPVAFNKDGGKVGGWDFGMTPIKRAFLNWFEATEALEIPDAVRYEDGNTSLTDYIGMSHVDMRRGNPFGVPLRTQSGMLRTAYYPVIDRIAVT